MFCPKCGKQLADGVRFCSGCGAALPSVGEQAQGGAPAASPEPPRYAYAQQPVYAQQQPAYSYAPQAAPAAKKKPNWALIVLAVAVLAAVYWFYLDRDPEKAVREHVFSQYGSVSIETALQVGIPDSTWTWSSNRIDLNNYTVTAVGRVEDRQASLEFSVTYSGRTPNVRLTVANTVDNGRITDADGLDYILDDIYYDYAYYRR